MIDTVQSNPAGKTIRNGNTRIWQYVAIEAIAKDLIIGIENTERHHHSEK